MTDFNAPSGRSVPRDLLKNATFQIAGPNLGTEVLMMMGLAEIVLGWRKQSLLSLGIAEGVIPPGPRAGVVFLDSSGQSVGHILEPDPLRQAVILKALEEYQATDPDQWVQRDWAEEFAKVAVQFET